MNFKTTRRKRGEISGLELRAHKIFAAESQGNNSFHLRQFQRSIEPAAAIMGCGHTHPVGVVIEVNYSEWFDGRGHQHRGEMMVIARAVKGHERPTASWLRKRR